MSDRILLNTPPFHPSRRALRRPLAAIVLVVAMTLLSTAASATSVFTKRGPASINAWPQSARWIPPVGSRLTVSGPYLAPPTPYASGHRGIDLVAGPGLAVRAPAAGTVSFVGTVVDRRVLSMRIDEHTVLSLEPVASELSVGDVVEAGDNLGSVSSGGHCFDECLHLGVRFDNEYVNPMRFFLGRPTLRPWPAE